MTASPSPKKVSDKLLKVQETFTVNRYDNGYMLEVSGRTGKGDYKTAKIIVSTPDDLISLVREVLALDLVED